MESTLIKIEPIPSEIKTENDVYNSCIEERCYEAAFLSPKDDIQMKSEFNYVPEKECTKNVGIKCECPTCICKTEVIDPLITDYNINISLNKEAKLKESNNKNLLSNDSYPSEISDPSLTLIDCYDEQKIDISETTLEFGGVSSFDQEHLRFEIKIENPCKPIKPDDLLDSQTGQKVELIQTNERLCNENGGDLKAAKFECAKNGGPANKNTNARRPCIVNNEPHVCPSCLKTFSIKLSLDFHIWCFHSDNRDVMRLISSKIYDCPECKQQFIEEDKWRNHMINQHNYDEFKLEMISANKYNCYKCDKRFVNKRDLDCHIRSHNNDETITTNVYECPVCKNRFITKNLFYRHVVTFHNNDQRLLKMISSKVVYNCPKCNKQLSCKFIFESHILNIHYEDANLLKIISRKTHDCHKCKRRFLQKGLLDTHISVKHSDGETALKNSRKKYNCPKCNKDFLYKVGLQSHILRIHSDNENLLTNISSKINDCPKCEKRFIEKSKLKSHMKTKKHSKSHMKTKKHSKSHMKTKKHSNDGTALIKNIRNNYNCSNCNKNFRFKINFDSHILNIHYDDENFLKIISRTTYDCSKCKRRFISKSKLDTHIVKKHGFH